MQLVVNIVVLASIYALICCGYVLIYRVSRVVSLAHGELMMLGAYGLYATASLFAGHPLGAIAAAALLAIVLGGLVYFLLMRHMTGEMVLAAVLTTIALGILLRGVIVLVWGAQEQHPLHVLGWQNVALPVGPRAKISVVGPDAGADHRRRLSRSVGVPAPHALGHPHARGRPESAARRPARHRPARHLRPGLEPGHLHRRSGGHADRVRFRARPGHGRHRPQGVSRRAGRRAR